MKAPLETLKFKLSLTWVRLYYLIRCDLAIAQNQELCLVAFKLKDFTHFLMSILRTQVFTCIKIPALAPLFCLSAA